MTNEILLDAFRHNAWATRQLLEFCAGLPGEQLQASTTGTYGGILETFNHFVLSDGSYLRRLSGRTFPWIERDESTDLATLATWAEDAARGWEEFFAEPFDSERIFVIDDGVREVHAGIFIAQALHHTNAHREQICAILTGLGHEPPDMQPWEYAWATGRIWDR